MSIQIYDLAHANLSSEAGGKVSIQIYEKVNVADRQQTPEGRALAEAGLGRLAHANLPSEAGGLDDAGIRHVQCE